MAVVIYVQPECNLFSFPLKRISLLHVCVCGRMFISRNAYMITLASILFAMLNYDRCSNRNLPNIHFFVFVGSFSVCNINYAFMLAYYFCH